MQLLSCFSLLLAHTSLKARFRPNRPRALFNTFNRLSHLRRSLTPKTFRRTPSNSRYEAPIRPTIFGVADADKVFPTFQPRLRTHHRILPLAHVLLPLAAGLDAVPAHRGGMIALAPHTASIRAQMRTAGAKPPRGSIFLWRSTSLPAGSPMAGSFAAQEFWWAISIYIAVPTLQVLLLDRLAPLLPSVARSRMLPCSFGACKDGKA